MCETECQLKTHCGHAASCRPMVLMRGADNNHICTWMCRLQAPLPPAMWCVADSKEPASVNTWAGLESPRGRKKGQPCLHAQLTRAGKSGPLYLSLPILPQWKYLEVVKEQYWVTWASYPRHGLPRDPVAIVWAVGTSECFSSLVNIFPLLKKLKLHLLIMEIFKQTKKFNEPPVIHHPASTMMNLVLILSHFLLGCPCLGFPGQSWFKLVVLV